MTSRVRTASSLGLLVVVLVVMPTTAKAATRLDPGPVAATTTSAPFDPEQFRVRSGDTITSIADRGRVPGGWPALYESNRQLIGPDPARLVVGTLLVPPATAAAPQAGAGVRSSPTPTGPAPAGADAAPAPVAGGGAARVDGSAESLLSEWSAPWLAGAGVATAVLLCLLVFTALRRQGGRQGWYLTPPALLSASGEKVDTASHRSDGATGAAGRRHGRGVRRRDRTDHLDVR